jgi:hypothetical protein
VNGANTITFREFETCEMDVMNRVHIKLFNLQKNNH